MQILMESETHEGQTRNTKPLNLYNISINKIVTEFMIESFTESKFDTKNIRTV